MQETTQTNRSFGTWFGGLFVIAVFLLIWVMAVMRLHNHYNGESFLHRGGLLDSLVALLAPATILVRIHGMRNIFKVRQT